MNVLQSFPGLRHHLDRQGAIFGISTQICQYINRNELDGSHTREDTKTKWHASSTFCKCTIRTIQKLGVYGKVTSGPVLLRRGSCASRTSFSLRSCRLKPTISSLHTAVPLHGYRYVRAPIILKHYLPYPLAITARRLISYHHALPISSIDCHVALGSSVPSVFSTSLGQIDHWSYVW